MTVSTRTIKILQASYTMLASLTASQVSLIRRPANRTGLRLKISMQRSTARAVLPSDGSTFPAAHPPPRPRSSGGQCAALCYKHKTTEPPKTTENDRSGLLRKGTLYIGYNAGLMAENSTILQNKRALAGERSGCLVEHAAGEAFTTAGRRRYLLVVGEVKRGAELLGLTAQVLSLAVGPGTSPAVHTGGGRTDRRHRGTPSDTCPHGDTGQLTAALL